MATVREKIYLRIKELGIKQKELSEKLGTLNVFVNWLLCKDFI